MQAEIYTWTTCPFCVKAKALLDEHGVTYKEHIMDGDMAELEAVKKRFNHPTVPIVLLDGKYIGGFSELQAAAQDW